MALIDPNDEALVALLRDALTKRAAADFRHALSRGLSRKEVERILEVLDPPPAPIDERDWMYRDFLDRKISIDDRVEMGDDTSELFERRGIVVGLGDKRDENVVQVRFDGGAIVTPIYPSKLFIHDRLTRYKIPPNDY